eukprot:PITA_34803
MLSCRLEFECTNNTTEYEALVQGLYKEIGVKFQYLKVFGDSEIIVKQVRNTIHCLSNHLKHYQLLVQELTSHFLAFNISSIPRSQNSAADLLANVASKLLPSEDYSPDRFSVELLFRPSIPDNVSNWRVFNQDDDILQFMTSEKSYDNQIIEEDEHDIQMRDKHEENSIPKHVVKLEDLYNIKDRFKPVSNSKLQSSTLSGRQKKSAFPLQPVNIEQPFQQWGLDIIREITPNSSKQNKYILTATDYFTKWVEAIPLKTTNSEAIIEFIDQFIITRITQKNSIGSSPFKLVYGKEVVLPTNLILPSLALVQFIEESPSSSLQLRHDQILQLEEEREKSKIIHAKHQQIIKSSFDSISSISKQFQVSDLVLKWDKAHEDKGKHTKFQKMWLGPFQICEKISHSTFMLQDLSGLRDSLPVNGLILKKFFN